MYGKEYEGVIRTTYIIDESGIILKIFKKVNTKEHTEQILKEMEAEIQFKFAVFSSQ